MLIVYIIGYVLVVGSGPGNEKPSTDRIVCGLFWPLVLVVCFLALFAPKEPPHLPEAKVKGELDG